MQGTQIRLRGCHCPPTLPLQVLLPSPARLDTQAAIRRLLLWVFVLHAVLGAVLGLSVDEAHYLLYAAHPALSYFDHPPLVGWVQMPLVALGAPVGVLRLVPGLFWLLTVAGVHRLTLRLLAGQPVAPRAALGAVVALALAPVLHILGIGLLPDSLLMVLTVALMHQTWTLMQPGATARPAPWLVMGLLLGLSGLAKYTAVFTAVAMAMCIVGAQGWRVLRLPALWGGMAIAALLIAPVLLWNAQNHWISFTYQLAHGKGSVWQAAHVGRFLLTQLVVFGPLLLLRCRVGAVRLQPCALWCGCLPFRLRSLAICPAAARPCRTGRHHPGLRWRLSPVWGWRNGGEVRRAGGCWPLQRCKRWCAQGCWD